MAAPVEEWTAGGTALTSLMDVERRHGKSFIDDNMHSFSLLDYLFEELETKMAGYKESSQNKGNGVYLQIEMTSKFPVHEW